MVSSKYLHVPSPRSKVPKTKLFFKLRQHVPHREQGNVSLKTRGTGNWPVDLDSKCFFIVSFPVVIRFIKQRTLEYAPWSALNDDNLRHKKDALCYIHLRGTPHAQKSHTHRERPSLGANSRARLFSHAEGGVFLGESLLKAYVIWLLLLFVELWFVHHLLY